MHLGHLSGHFYDHFTPVALHLFARPSFKAHRGLAGSLLSLRLYVLAQNAVPARVAVRLDFAQDDLGIPDAFR